MVVWGFVLVTFTVRVLLCLLLLRKMALAVCDHLPHMVDVILVILFRVLLRILLKDLNNLPPTARSLVMDWNGHISLSLYTFRAR